jgi:hypothetical protein
MLKNYQVLVQLATTVSHHLVNYLRKFWAFDWILSLSSLIEEIIAKCGASRLKIFEIY